MFGRKLIFTVLLVCSTIWVYGQNFDTEKITEFLKQNKVRNFTEVMDIDVARLAPSDQKGKPVVLIGIYTGASNVKGDIQEKYKPDRFRVLGIKSSATGFSVYAPTKGKPELVRKIALLNEDDVVAICGKVKEIKYKVARGPRGRNVTERVFCFEVDDVYVIPEKLAYLPGPDDNEGSESEDSEKPRKRRNKSEESRSNADEEDNGDREKTKQKPAPKAAVKPAPEVAAKPEAKPAPKPAPKPVVKPEVKQEKKPDKTPAPAQKDNVTEADEWS